MQNSNERPQLSGGCVAATCREARFNCGFRIVVPHGRTGRYKHVQCFLEIGLTAGDQLEVGNVDGFSAGVKLLELDALGHEKEQDKPVISGQFVVLDSLE